MKNVMLTANIAFRHSQVLQYSVTGPMIKTCVALRLRLVADDDEVDRRAKAAGAEIVTEIKDESYGGRGFSCRDLEGRLWAIGTYDPWA